MSTTLSRRGFVIGGLAAGVLTACGTSGGGTAEPRPQLVSLFSSDRVITAGLPQRIPFAVVDAGGLLLGDTDEVEVVILADGDVVTTTSVRGRVVDHDHTAAKADTDHQHADLLRYYALRAELPKPGIYDLEVDFGSGGVGRLPVQAFDRSEVALPLPGDPLPPVVTPTLERPEGISPLCTRSPEPCSFHQHDVAEVIGTGPLALLVATPALCFTAYCGPVLDTLIELAPDFAGVTFVHLEVYANAADVDGNYADPALELARPVRELGLAFEPSLFLVDTSGTVVDRIDNVFDRSEAHDALAALATP
ncbi:MAG: hypothetical protein OEV40_04900 [Acidimicrobiia bacterium]|nr:hypothetical protein [Acidimicrobiia bacterium]